MATRSSNAVLLSRKSLGLLAEGKSFIARSPTPGTGIASLAAPTAFDDTKPFLLIKNGNADGGDDIVLDQIKLRATAAGTAGTAVHYDLKLDMANPLRYTSGGETLASVNCDGGSSETSGATIYCGALVAAAVASGARLLGGGQFSTTIPIIGDQYILTFDDAGPGAGGQLVAAAAAKSIVHNHPPVAIAPGQWLAFHLWLPSQSAASSYEVEIAYHARTP